jgi:hypothetical protein
MKSEESPPGRGLLSGVDLLPGYSLQKRENKENRSINDDDDVNVNPKPLT